jgi:hypothetical protein
MDSKMNERIQELAEQAILQANEAFDQKGKDYPGIVMEKFAELIVRECIEIVEPCKCGCCDGEPEGIITDTIIKQIKQHFGVAR